MVPLFKWQKSGKLKPDRNRYLGNFKTIPEVINSIFFTRKFNVNLQEQLLFF